MLHAACIVNTCFVIFPSEALGEKADIHTGGMDLKFPHHDNEIAQAEVRTLILGTLIFFFFLQRHTMNLS